MYCRSALLLLRRCVTARHVTSAGIKSRSSVLSSGYRAVLQPTWIQTRCLPSLSQTLSALTSKQRALCTQATSNDEYESLDDSKSDTKPERQVHIVQVRGLPWTCTAQDIMEFFSECRICGGVSGIHITLNRYGRNSGRAFIEMEREEDVINALKMHREYLGARYIEVKEVHENEARALLKQVMEGPSPKKEVRLRGLPFTCTEADIASFFSGLEIAENGIHMVTDRGRKTGVAFVSFTTEEAVEEALLRDKGEMGTRYIEVFPCQDYDWSRLKSSQSPQMNHQYGEKVAFDRYKTPKTGSALSSSLSKHFIHMRGLPFNISGRDVVMFFSPLSVSKILIEYNPDGMPSGEASVYFSCHQHTIEAMSRDKKYMGQRYIELFLNSED
ncbi:G-rich sequence factor 1 isoform 2-T2 [Aulostomus maculatus]